jgi:hypothetical protein
MWNDRPLIDFHCKPRDRYQNNKFVLIISDWFEGHNALGDIAVADSPNLLGDWEGVECQLGLLMHWKPTRRVYNLISAFDFPMSAERSHRHYHIDGGLFGQWVSDVTSAKHSNAEGDRE